MLVLEFPLLEEYTSSGNIIPTAEEYTSSGNYITTASACSYHCLVYNCYVIHKYRKDLVNILFIYHYTYLVKDSLCPIKGDPRLGF